MASGGSVLELIHYLYQRLAIRYADRGPSGRRSSRVSRWRHATRKPKLPI